VLSYQKDANLIIQTNVAGTNNLMSALVEIGSVRKFINLGSTFEYGPKYKDILETEIPEPVSLYGIAKVAQTDLARYFALQRGLPTLTLRIFTPYGPYEQTGRLIPNIIQSIIKKKTLNVISPKAKRDFIYVEDVVTAMIKAAKSRFGNGEIFNIGSGKEYSVEEIIHIAEKITGDKLKVDFIKGKEREFDKFGKYGFANIRKAKKLKWLPAHSINEGMTKTYQWFKENLHLYK
ncbi:MAG: NAD-dependent epimerase/dehydratase family protein, partial [Nitrosopumilaceae archaeon]